MAQLITIKPDWLNLPDFNSLVLAHPGSPGHSPGGHKTGCSIVVPYTTILVNSQSQLS